jgi:hypothetical protein
MQEAEWTEYLQETIDFKHNVDHFECIAVMDEFESIEEADPDALVLEYELSGEDPDDEINMLLETFALVTSEREGKGDGLYGSIIHSDKYRVI